MIILKVASLVLWLLLIPFCIGALPVQLIPEKDRTPGTRFLAGYFTIFALFELIGIPIALLLVYHSFSVLTYLFMSACLVLTIAGGVLLVKNRRADRERYPYRALLNCTTEEKIGYLLFFLLVAFQLYMAFTRASFDGDDAYYGVQGVIAQQIDMLYRFDAYSGNSIPLDARHALALTPVWEAFIGRMSGVHTTIIAHSVMPLLLIPLTYLLYFKIGQKLFAHKKDMLPVFLILLAVFQMFGNVSIYTAETFLLTRTWQGKSIAANLILPAVVWIFLCLFDEEKQKTISAGGYWVLLSCIHLAAGMSSSLAVLLSALLSLGLAVLFAIRKRRFGILFRTGLTCIPGGIYMLIYLLISR